MSGAARGGAGSDVMRLGQEVLETPRLTLRELRPDDLDFVAGVLADPEVARYYARPLARREAQAWLERQLLRYRRDGHGLWRVDERRSGQPVGQVGLLIQLVEGRREPEIGYLLDRRFWGRGYATEAAIATRDAAFSRWRYDHVISLIRPENRPSRRVAERLGMRPGRRVEFQGYLHIVYRLEAPAGAEMVS